MPRRDGDVFLFGTAMRLFSLNFFQGRAPARPCGRVRSEAGLIEEALAECQ
jgi:hypothetical protein